MMQSILVVDDDKSIVEVLSRYLDDAGFASVCAYDGSVAAAHATAARPDLALLDIALPGTDGLELTRRFCAQGIPVILVTARQGGADRLLGLELGADDYITKPFSPREVVARVKAVLRRYPQLAPHPREVLTVGSMTVDAARRVVSVEGVPAGLTRAEFEIVRALADRPGVVCSRAQLLDVASGGESSAHEKTVDVHVKNIRRKLGFGADSPEYIKAVTGIGYRLQADRTAPLE